VARSSVQRWLKAFQQGKVGGRRPAAEPVNKTPREIAELIWDIFARNPMWGRHRMAMTMWALGVFISATTVRDILLRPRPQASTPAPAQAKEAGKPRQITARYPNHVWSVDHTRVWRWGVWPTWVLVAIDHFSRAVMAIAPLEGPNAGWVVEVLEEAFLHHGVLATRGWNRPEQRFQFVRSCPVGGHRQDSRCKNPTAAQLHYARGYSARNAVLASPALRAV
jgi:transposase InsO family protein